MSTTLQDKAWRWRRLYERLLIRGIKPASEPDQPLVLRVKDWEHLLGVETLCRHCAVVIVPAGPSGWMAAWRFKGPFAPLHCPASRDGHEPWNGQEHTTGDST